ncbi:SGNH hydrolase-type esterase domain-containing protein [Artemisia annua]|uniref:SGNH hydrolase-type esterase domain-containing protein n=1 Tax=Artemisia annua TaxID=35608 RepID=A0A2U1NEQ5_ARTAN|nr:SGNH hydrolase-type esterase domain-containing protein [Artemisia annua]
MRRIHKECDDTNQNIPKLVHQIVAFQGPTLCPGVLSSQESMIIGSININGVGTTPKKEWVRDLCRENHLNFIGIQEFKTNKEDLDFILSLWGKNNCDFAVKKSCGSSGGIIALWDCSLFQKHNIINNEDGFIAIISDWIKFGIECLMIVVYAPQDVNKKILLWNQLNHLIVNFHGMSTVLGDFNEVHHEHERLGTLFCKRGAALFNGFINNSGLIDLPMGGKKFTRMNKFGTKLSKVDRILVSHHFTSNWPNAQLTALLRKHSDHCPLVLKTHSTDFGPIPFKFFNSWLLDEDFPSIVSSSWYNHHAPNSSYQNHHPSTILKSKLQSLKKHIRDWHASVSFKEHGKISEFKAKISVFDTKAEHGTLGEHEMFEHLDLLKKIEDSEHLKRQTLGLKNFIPPYLAPTTVGSVILHGVNYASGAGGILNETGANYYGRIPMDLQLHSFAKTKDDIISLIGKPAANKLLANALFSATMGSNDFVNNYILPPASNHTRKLMPPKIFIGILISTYRRQLKTLYGMGARKIVVTNIPPMGCCPYLRDLYPSPDQECAAFPNNLAQLFNRRLRRLLIELTRKLKGSTFVYADVYNIVQDIVKNYKSHGFEVADVSCCGTFGKHSGVVPCVPNSKVCPDRSKYLFWDPYHVTENAYKIIAKRLMDGDSKDISPMNIRALSKI